MSAARQAHKPPVRGAPHDALDVFLGNWKAEGWSFGGPNQDPGNPRGNATRWHSTHRASWHTGAFFLIQDERAQVAGGAFDTLSILGWDEDAGCYVARTFENHGFHRHYGMAADGKLWTITGETERACIEFSADGSRQTISWEWRPQDDWLPLCDRVAEKS